MEVSSNSKNNINLEIKWFLATLKSRSTQKLQIDADSLGELAAIVSNIGALIGDANIVSADNNNKFAGDWEFYQRMCESADWKYFQFDNFVTCRVCHMQIGLSKEEIEVHIQSEKHRWNVVAQKSPTSPTVLHSIETNSIVNISPKNIEKNDLEMTFHENHTENGGKDINDSANLTNYSDADERDVHAVNGSHDEQEFGDSSTVVESNASVSCVSSLNSTVEDNNHPISIKQNPLNPKNVALKTNMTNRYDDSSENLLRMSSQLSAYLEMNIAMDKPINAALPATIKRIFTRNIDHIVKQEMDLSTSKIMIARRDLSTAVNVAVAMKRKTYLYGSYAYGAPPDNGIINIFFDYHKIHYTGKSVPKSCTDACESLMSHLNASKLWTDVKIMIACDQKNAVEAKRKCSGTICHFTFDSGVPVAAANLIEHFFELQPMCHKMVIFIRHWQMMINKENKNCLPLSGYFLTILVIFFFQFIGLLPSVHELQSNDGVTKVNFNGFYVHFDKTTKITPAANCTKIYLQRFFSFYGDLLKTTENFFISPFHGKIICRIEETAKNATLTAEQIAEQTSFRTMRGGVAKWSKKSIYVQDLFLRGKNIGSEIPTDVIKSFQVYCAQSSTILAQK